LQLCPAIFVSRQVSGGFDSYVVNQLEDNQFDQRPAPSLEFSTWSACNNG
jgi:hypothetical protein